MNDQNRADHRRIQPPPGWLGADPEPAGQPDEPPAAPHGHPPEPGVPGYPGYPATGYGRPYPQPYGNQPYGSGPYGAAPPPPPRGSRRGLTTVLVLVLLSALGAGGYLAYRSGVLAPYLGVWAAAPTGPAAPTDPSAPAEPDAAGTPEDGGTTDGGFGATQPGMSTTVPGCPFTAEQVTSMIGQAMVDKGTCLFGDGKGVAQLGIEVHSASSTSAALGYSRQQASKQYLLVEDLKSGDKGYVAYKNTSAEAVAVTAQGGYTITMSGFQRFNGFTYEEPLTSIISALPR